MRTRLLTHAGALHTHSRQNFAIAVHHEWPGSARTWNGALYAIVWGVMPAGWDSVDMWLRAGLCRNND